MSEVKYNLSHALCMVYLEMTAADGKFEDSEMAAAAKKVMKWEDVFEYDANKTWTESIGWFKSFDSVKSRVETVFNILKVLKDKMPKPALVEIAKDLAAIGQADGEIAENEKKFFNAFLEVVDLTFDDLK
tara:strand:- start:464 stop:853 length:390 start_codon:yes stop_codon:yes gene_type:complete